jgi:hypothetical protein
MTNEPTLDERIAARVAELTAKRCPSLAEREELAMLTYEGPVARRLPESDEVPF